jgi:hypothetical protein
VVVFVCRAYVKSVRSKPWGDLGERRLSSICSTSGSCTSSCVLWSDDELNAKAFIV